LSLLRAVGESGSVLSMERREEFAEIAAANVRTFFGSQPTHWECQVGDFQDLAVSLPAMSVDRVVLDMLAPWECVDAVAHVLEPGGVLAVYVATATQLSRVVEALRETGRFTPCVSEEILVRPWHVEGLAVRPEHRMIGHTGFVMSTRIVAPGVDIPPTKRHHTKPEYSVDDIEAWTPGATGQRAANEKTIRKTVRKAKDRATRSESP